jgi:SET domain-containing protein
MSKDNFKIDGFGGIDCSNVYIDKCKFGYGVFARRDFKKDEIIEFGMMYRLKNVDGNENPHLFTWSDDRTVWAGASGCIPWYNHSDIPNIKKVGDLINDTMVIVALRDIKKGEELYNTYFSSKWRECFKDLE